MDQKHEERFIQLINQGIQEVVIPALNAMAEELKELRVEFKKELKKEIQASEGRIRSEMNQRFDEVNDKLERLDRRDDRLADEQVDIRTRLRRVENAVFKKVD